MREDCYNTLMQNFVFDLYGTLIDIRTDESDPDFRRDFAAFFESCIGADVDVWRFLEEGSFCDDDFKEIDFAVQMRRIFEMCGKAADDATIVSLANFFRKRSTLRLALYDGVKETLLSLRARGCGLYVLSNAQALFTLPELEELGIAGCFDGVEISSDFGYKKPCALFFERLLDKYSLDASRCVYVGNDIVADIIPAKKLGMRTVYIHTEISPPEDSVQAAAATADVVIDGDFRALRASLEAFV